MADKRISQLVERVDIANNDVLPIVASGATTTNKVTISTIQDFMQGNLNVGVTSVGLSMPSAFSVTNSPVTTSGNISVTGAGTTAQYIRGDGSLADFPASSGGGSSISYYLNGSVSQGTIGGVAYQELSKVPILGSGTDFTIAADGYIASFITDIFEPNLLEIPGGNWNFETYFQASSGGGSPTFYVELYKVSYPTGTATLIASNSGTPELIAFGTTIHPYFSTLAVPTTALALTDRLAIRYYVTHAGRTITMHTENSHLCQIITTFSTGLTALNGLTAQVQNFATGTNGTDFNIESASTTHVFNLPTASGTNRGALSSTDWTTFNGKVGGTGANGQVAFWNGTSSQTGDTSLTWDNTNKRLTVGAVSSFPWLGSQLEVRNQIRIFDPLSSSHGVRFGFNSNIPFIQGFRETVGAVNLQLQPSGGNVLINTTTDAGFRLDVNGTARVQGVLTATADAVVNGVNIGVGGGAIGSNTRVGLNALNGNTTGTSNTAIGWRSLQTNSTGASNVAIGTQSLQNSTTASQNTAIGTGSLQENTIGGSNTAIGNLSLLNNTTGGNNSAIGNIAGRFIADGTTNLTIANNSVFIGAQTRAAADNQTNQIVIGFLAIGLGSNTTVIGNSSTTFGRWFGNLLVGSSTNSGQMLQVTGTSLLNGLSTIQGTTASDSGQLGAELLTTGTGDASWTGTSFATGYTHVAGSTTTLTSTLAGVVSTFYQITYTVTGRTAGSFTIAFGGFTSSALTATGAVGPRATTTGTLVITPTSDFDGTLVLSIKVINPSSASVTFNSSAGTATNHIRISNSNTNTFIGLGSGQRNTTGINNSFFGFGSGDSNTSGAGNSFFGRVSGLVNTTGSNNSFFGSSSGQANTTGVSNSFFGAIAGRDNTSGVFNSFFGQSSGVVNTTGSSNSFFGLESGRGNTTASNNCFFGVQSGRDNTTGGNNSFFGTGAGQSNTTALNNSFFGQNSGLSNTTGANNSYFGLQAGASNILGGNNSFFGISAGRFSGSGTTAMTNISNSIYLGFQTRGLNATGTTNEIVIGYDVVGLGSNTTVLGNTSTTHGRWYGSLLLGTTTNAASSILTMESTTQGVLFPRMTTTQKNAIASPATGLVVYDTTLNKLAVYTGAAWETITSL